MFLIRKTATGNIGRTRTEIKKRLVIRATSGKALISDAKVPREPRFDMYNSQMPNVNS